MSIALFQATMSQSDSFIACLSIISIPALGTSMVKEPCSLMIAQFFKRRRALVEMISASGIGIGIALMSSLLHECIR